MTTSFTKSVGAAGVALLALAAPASAGGFGLKDDGGRTFEWSVNGGLTTDFVFRGVSNSDNDPAAFVGGDVSYGILYAGIWASSVSEDFTGNELEVDFYAGIKPVLGPATFDFGVIYYAYPGGIDPGPGGGDLDFVELKAGVSGDILPKLTATGYVYWSPEAAFDGGEYWVYEGSLSYALPKFLVFDPSISGTLGAVDNVDFDTDYTYWNAGLTLGYDKFSFDFRYWDTDDNGTLFGNLADERFVATVKFAYP